MSVAILAQSVVLQFSFSVPAVQGAAVEALPPVRSFRAHTAMAHAFSKVSGSEDADDGGSDCSEILESLISEAMAAAEETEFDPSSHISPECDLCDLPIPKGERSKWPKMGYEVLDKACFNALRCLERVLSKNKSLKTKVEKLRVYEPLKFKNIALKLISPKHKRPKGQVITAVEFLTVMCEEHSKVRKEKSLLFTKRQFIVWFMMHEAFTEDEATEKWKIEKQTRYSEVIDGKLRVAVEMPVELSAEHRWTTKKEATAKGQAGDTK